MLQNRRLKVAGLGLTFQIMILKKKFNQIFGKIFRGTPIWLSKCCVSKNDHPSTANDPTFLLQNPFTLKKCGCLQKTDFQDFSEIFFLHGQLLPPYSIWGLILILGGIKKPKKGKI